MSGHCFTDRDHCFTNYLVKTATAHVPTHVACQYQPVIRVVTVKTGFVVCQGSEIDDEEKYGDQYT